MANKLEKTKARSIKLILFVEILQLLGNFSFHFKAPLVKFRAFNQEISRRESLLGKQTVSLAVCSRKKVELKIEGFLITIGTLLVNLGSTEEREILNHAQCKGVKIV